MRWIYLASASLLMGTPSSAQEADTLQLPATCPCDGKGGQGAHGLNAAWNSKSTSDADRQRMLEIIQQNPKGRRGNKTDWDAALVEYYDYVRSEHPAQNEAELIDLIEQSIKRRLKDPSSAQFRWPYGFVQYSMRPDFRDRIYGYTTCGYVNARNSFGGFVGDKLVFAMFDDNGLVIAQEDDDSVPIFVEWHCSHLASDLPKRVQKISDETTGSTSNRSLADELAKLAQLHNDGLLSDEEFEAAKSKLLGDE